VFCVCEPPYPFSTAFKGRSPVLAAVRTWTSSHPAALPEASIAEVSVQRIVGDMACSNYDPCGPSSQKGCTPIAQWPDGSKDYH
jgi:hypothetical protein